MDQIPMQKTLNIKILIVEDNKLSNRLMEAALSSFGYTYCQVDNGEDAVKAVKENPDICLVLMDLKLPGMDGYETATRIKKTNPHIPVIAQTAFAMIGDREKALEAGCDDYISKPFNFSKLHELIRKYI